MKCSLLVLSCYLDEELDARRRGELEAHLVACQRCRGGLANLREEMERVGGLARVRIPDHSARFLLESVGLLGADDELPARSATAVIEPPADVPPWLAGEVGPALPWSVARPAPPRPAPHLSAPGPERYSGVPAVPFDVDAISELAASPPTIVDLPAAPSSWAPAAALAFDPTAPPAAPSAADTAISEPAPEPAGHQIDIDEAIAAVEPAQRDFPAALDAWISAQPAEPEPSRPEVGLSVALTAPEPPPDPVGHHAITGPIGRRRLFSASGPPRRGGPQTSPDAETGASPSPHPPAEPQIAAQTSAKPTVLAHVPPATDPGEPAVALTTPPSQVPIPPSYPMTDDDGLDEPIPVERFAGGPIPAPRAGLLAKIRDHFAMRRALARPGDDLADGVEIVSGTGAPSRGQRPNRAELARRRSEALRPSGMAPEPTPPAATTGIPADPIGEVTGRTSLPPRREPPLYQQLPPPARPSAFGAEAGLRARHRDSPDSPRRDVAELESVDSGGVTWRAPLADAAPPNAWQRPAPAEEIAAPASPWRAPALPAEAPTPWRPRDDKEIAAAIAAPPPATPEAPSLSPSQAREGRRLLALFGAAAVVMFAVGLASAHSSSPAPTTTATTQPSGSSNPGAPAGQSQPAAPAQGAVVQPSAPSQPPTQGEPGPSTGPQLNDAHTVGDGGTGWQISSIVFGDHHTYLRVRFDLTPNGAASGKPKVSVGFSDPTTLLVALYGVTPAGAAGGLPNTKIVTGVTLLQPSPIQGATVYQLKLAHPVTVNPLYTGSNPLLLVVDLTG